jgi:hypothetical protein
MTPRPGARAGRVAAGLAAAGLALAGCTTPEGGRTAYRAEAADTLDAARSHLGTARLALRAVLAGQLFATTADDTVTTAEEGLASLASSFSALQPPPGADDVRDQAEQVLSAGQEAMAEARIAARRGDAEGRRRALGDLAAAERTLVHQQESWS